MEKMFSTNKLFYFQSIKIKLSYVYIPRLLGTQREYLDIYFMLDINFDVSLYFLTTFILRFD